MGLLRVLSDSLRGFGLSKRALGLGDRDLKGVVALFCLFLVRGRILKV